MNLRNRSTLKRNFSKGRLLSENDFSDLIDSTVNKIDDGFAKNDKNGLQLAPSIESGRVLSVFNHITDPEALWHLDLEKNNEARILSLYGPNPQKQMSFHENGNIGINTPAPSFDLEVNGVAGMSGRVGTYAIGEKEGDGNWHTLLKESNGISIYEVVASIVGAEKTAQHAALHAIAIKVFDSKKIKKVRTNKGWFFNKLNIRWKKQRKKSEKEESSWDLQIRTMRSYAEKKNGQIPKIQYHITRLS